MQMAEIAVKREAMGSDASSSRQDVGPNTSPCASSTFLTCNSEPEVDMVTIWELRDNHRLAYPPIVGFRLNIPAGRSVKYPSTMKGSSETSAMEMEDGPIREG